MGDKNSPRFIEKKVRDARHEIKKLQNIFAIDLFKRLSIVHSISIKIEEDLNEFLTHDVNVIEINDMKFNDLINLILEINQDSKINKEINYWHRNASIMASIFGLIKPGNYRISIHEEGFLLKDIRRNKIEYF